MKRFFEVLKDIMYDTVDYIMMIVVIAIVALVINWRLGGLFAKDAIDTPLKDKVEVVNNNKPEDDDSNKDIQDTTEENDEEDNKQDSKVIVKVTIPQGSLPSKIGDILASNGLVNDKGEFVQKAQELKLDTKLKSGEFEIAKDSSLEEILKIITK